MRRILEMMNGPQLLAKVEPYLDLACAALLFITGSYFLGALLYALWLGRIPGVAR